jgi:heme A synthase
LKRLSTYALALTALIINVVVVLQGAVVRATGSGAGCGSHWPTCNGSVVPLNPSLETGIEFSHRLLSLVVLVLGFWLLLRARKARQQRPGLAALATYSFVFLVIEALIGGATVILGLTGDNTSVARGIWVASHLVNSLLLIGALAGTVVYARPKGAPAWPLRVTRQRPLVAILLVGVVGLLLLSFTGGIAAMGNTMFPSESLAAGLRADFSPDSHPLIRVRALHPLIAVTVGVYLFISLGFAWLMKPVPQAKAVARWLLGVYVAQVVIGVANLAFLAPIALQLLHLMVAVAAFALLSALSFTLLGGQAAAQPTAGDVVSDPMGVGATGPQAGSTTATLENI